jgi:hypothetical protein
VTSEDTPTMEFYIPEQFWAGSTIISENSELTTVPNSNLFTLIKEFNPTVIFIDVEGGEYDLLRKIKWNKLSVRNLVIEFHSHPDAISCISQIWPTLTSYYTSSASSSELQNYLQLSKRVTPITLTLSKKT